MTIPATFNTPSRIIEYAMKDAGFLQRGDLPNSDELVEYSNRLLDMINLWQTQGLKLWLNQDLSVTLTAGTNLYTLGLTGTVVMNKPMRVIQAYCVNTGNVSRPIMIISRDEWSRLSDRTNTGAINSIFVDKQQLTLDVYLWLTPDAVSATDILHLVTQYQVTNFTNLTEVMNFPQEWAMALRWGLADDICGGQPSAIMERCANRAKIYRDALEDWDVEDTATKFQPDMGNSYTRGGFR